MSYERKLYKVAWNALSKPRQMDGTGLGSRRRFRSWGDCFSKFGPISSASASNDFENGSLTSFRADQGFIHEKEDETRPQSMLSAPYLHQDRDDKLIWMLDSRGGYTVKSCSAAVAGFLLPCQTMNIPNVWKPTALPKVEFFTWLVVLDRLNTKEFFAAPWNNYTSRKCMLLLSN